MIKEIVQFTKALPPETFSKNLELKEGLYMFLDIQEENGEAVLKNVDTQGELLEEDYKVYYTKKTEMNPFFEECIQRIAFIDPVSSNKAWNRKFFGVACNPYALCFKKELYCKEDRHDENTVKDSIIDYFKNSKQYQTEEEYDQINMFERFLNNNLWIFLKSLNQFNDLSNKSIVYIFLKSIPIDVFEKPFKKYQAKNLFNKEEYNASYESDILGISDNLSGFNDKKRFLKHQTSSQNLNFRINGDNALLLWKFFKLQQAKQLPNPCPIFVDSDELNRVSVKLHQDGKVLSHAQLVKSLLNNPEDELSNFYLIYFQGGMKGSKIIDIDFVPQFQHVVKDVKLIEIFNLGEKFSSKRIDTVFQLQDEIFNKIFNSKLISKNGGLNYFSELDSKYYTNVEFNLLLQFRKSIYDYIYKSQHQSITCKMFDDMMRVSILEDIRIDEFKNEKHSRDYQIKEKLNIWFSLYTYFSQNKNRENMPTNVKKHKEMIHQIIERTFDESDFNEKEFAFTAGQVIYYILDKSKSGDKSYNRLEPFLQKSNYCDFLDAIVRIFDIYKHENFSNNFKQPYAWVLDFDYLSKSIIPLKKLMPNILAGFFADNQLFSNNNN